MYQIVGSKRKQLLSISVLSKQNKELAQLPNEGGKKKKKKI